MARRSDAVRTVRPSRICEMGGVIRQTRDTWVDRGLLSGREECGELDLIELVVLRTVSTTIRKGHVAIAWQQIRPKLREALPNTGLSLVWDVQARKAEFASNGGEIADLVRHGRPVQVIDLAGRIEDARNAFRNELAASARRTEAEQVKGSSRSARRLPHGG